MAILEDDETRVCLFGSVQFFPRYDVPKVVTAQGKGPVGRGTWVVKASGTVVNDTPRLLLRI